MWNFPDIRDAKMEGIGKMWRTILPEWLVAHMDQQEEADFHLTSGRAVENCSLICQIETSKRKMEELKTSDFKTCNFSRDGVKRNNTKLKSLKKSNIDCSFQTAFPNPTFVGNFSKKRGTWDELSHFECLSH